MMKFIENAGNKISEVMAMLGIVAILQKNMMKGMAKLEVFKARAKRNLCNQRGDQNLGTAVTILITVVIGALLLAGLYLLFEDVVMPTVTKKIEEMFDYKG